MTQNQTKTVTISRRLRPLRLAFLVKPSDKASLHRIFQINTCIWGGRFNPIIPVYNRTPKTWGMLHMRPHTAKTIISGYIDAFEPDFIVSSTKELHDLVSFPKERLLLFKDVLDAESEDPIGCGVDVIELFSDLYRKEFQFQKRHPVEVLLPTSHNKNFSLMNAMCFGEFPQDEQLKYLQANYIDAFDAKETKVEPHNLLKIFQSRKLTPLRLGSADLTVNDRGQSEPALFYMDGTSSLDLIDYWNLRAIGWKILPLPRQWATGMVEDCAKFITNNYIPYRHNKEMMHGTAILCARSVAFEELQKFAEELKTIPKGSLSCQRWYPRIWDDWARDKDHVVRAHVISQEASTDIVVVDKRVNFSDISPAFAEKFGGRNTPRWANIVQISDYSSSTELATVIPPKLPNLHRILQTVERNEIWATSEGIVTTSKYRDWTHRWQLPMALQVFSSWMQEKGFQFQISSAGNIAFQIVRSLNGSWGIGNIAQEEIIQLLNKMANGASVHARQWFSLLTKLNKNNSEVAKRQLNYLLNRKVLQLGLELQCHHCSQHTWFALENLSEAVNCEKCLQTYDFPLASPPKDNWKYRAIGAFSVRNYAQGGYCVALALRFFTHSLHSEVTWVPSFTLKQKNLELEADFGIFWQQSKYQRTNPVLIMGECKTYDHFEKKDLDRMRKLGDTFPGSVLVFCTLRRQLEPKEKRMISILARKGRRHLGAERWHNPVLVLTGTELLSDSGPPYCWKDAGEPYATFAQSYRGYHGMQELCEATQRLHLGMESYWDWYHKKVEEQKRRRNKRLQHKQISQ